MSGTKGTGKETHKFGSNRLTQPRFTRRLVEDPALAGRQSVTRTRSPANCAGAMVVGRFAVHALRVVRQFAGLKAGSIKAALSRPAHQCPAGAYLSREEYPRGCFANASRCAALHHCEKP
jgi:hypothetical protein